MSLCTGLKNYRFSFEISFNWFLNSRNFRIFNHCIVIIEIREWNYQIAVTEKFLAIYNFLPGSQFIGFTFDCFALNWLKCSVILHSLDIYDLIQGLVAWKALGTQINIRVFVKYVNFCKLPFLSLSSTL